MSDTAGRLKHIVGEKNLVEHPVFSSSSVGFKAAGSLLTPDFLVRPMNSSQVQAIVQLANELHIPLIPVSSSAPHMTGGVSSSVPGTVIVDLSRMKRILKVNKRHRLALIEPGVTWEELAAELKKEGLRITQPLLPKQGKSVIASLLDREPLLSTKYQYNMTEPLRSLEIIFGSGDKIYSGMGGHRGETDAAWEDGTVPLTNAGPHQLDFMKMVTASQGSMGIVTWASVKVESLGTEEKALFFEGDSFENVAEVLHKVVKYRFGDEVCILNRPALGAILATDADSMAGIGSRLARWTAFVNIKWGGLRAESKVKAQYEDIVDIAREHGLVPVKSVAGMPVKYVVKRILAQNDTDAWKKRSTGASKEIFFISTMDRIPAQLDTASAVADAYGYSFTTCPVYIQPLHQGVAVHCHIVLPITESLSSAEMREFYNGLSRAVKSSGGFYSRPYDIWADLMYGSNTQNTNLTRKMKDIFDPKHIMNPGKLCF